MRRNEAQQSSIKLLSGERSELRSASEASPFSFKCFAWVSSHSLEIAENLMLSVGSSRGVLGVALKCWNLLHSVPKLIKSRARFPFFVKAGFHIFCLFLVHICKVPRPKGAPKQLSVRSSDRQKYRFGESPIDNHMGWWNPDRPKTYVLEVRDN